MKVRNFHVLASFYHRCIKDFSSIMALLIECMKKGSFQWTRATQRTFQTIKDKLHLAPIFALPNFDLIFKVECDASDAGVRAVLT